MKKILFSTLALLFSMISFAEDDYTHLRIAVGTWSETVGDGIGIAVFGVNSDNTETQLAFDAYTLTSSDESIVAVESTAYIKGVSAGTATLTATLISDTSISGTAEITVKEASEEDSDYDHLRIAVGAWSETVGDGIGIAVFGVKSDNTETQIGFDAYTLTSSDENVVAVESTSYIKGVGAGTATLTATLISDTSISGTAEITVSASTSVDWDSEDILKGQTRTAYASSTREGDASSVVGSTSNWSSCAWNGETSSLTHNDETGLDTGNDADPWWFVDLGKEYNVESVAFLWANCYAATYEIVTASSLIDETAAVSNDNVNWNTTTYSGTGCNEDVSSTDINARGVRFIKIHGLTGGGIYSSYGMRFTRFYLTGSIANPEMTVTLDGTTATCTGEWVESTYNDIDATVIDLQAVSGVPTDFTATSKNPNAMVLAQSGVTGNNVCNGTLWDGATIATLALTDGYDFAPGHWFYVTNGSYTVTLSAKHYSIIYLPFGVSTIPEGVTMYSVTSLASDKIMISETTSLTKEQAYVVYSENGGTFTFTGSGTQCGASANAIDHTTTAGSGKIVGTLVAVTVPSDGTAYMFNKNNELEQVTGSNVTLWPFAGYITGVPSGSSAKLGVAVDGETTGINATEPIMPADGRAYNMAGQRVGSSYKGLIIKNGRKYINK